MLFVLFVLLVSVIGAIVLYFYIQSFQNVWKKKGVYHVERIPFFGNILDLLLFRVSLPQFIHRFYLNVPQDDTKLVGFYVFNRPALVVRDPELLKHILIKDFDHFVNHTFYVDPHFDAVSAGNLFFNATPRWKKFRNTLSPVFTSGKIRNMFTLMKEVVDDLVPAINKEKTSTNVIEIRELLARYSTDIISSSALGFKANCLIDEKSIFRRFGSDIFELSRRRSFDFLAMTLSSFLVKLLRNKLFPVEIINFFSKMFWEMIDGREASGGKRNDLIDFLIDLKSKGLTEGNKVENHDDNFVLTKSELLSVPVMFFVAGSETTSSTMTYVLHELAWHQDIQDKVRAEVLSVLKKHDGQITYEGLQEMKLLECCINEALRLYPLTGLLNRLTTKDYKVPDSNLVIEKGTEIYISLDGLQLDPQHFPNPQQFDPERFSDERKSEIKNMTFMPFGTGPRNCLGMRFGMLSAKNGLAAMLANFIIEPTSSSPRKIEYSPLSFLNTPNTKLHFKLTEVK